MLPVKRIFCPTDFSEPSYEALKVADEMALHFSAELFLIHVVKPISVNPVHIDPTSFNLPMYEKERVASAEQAIERISGEKLSADISSSTIVVQGDPAYQIVASAADENADLIVIATHGLTGWKKLIFGSVTEKVIRLAKCPVLSIRMKSPAT
ncbi:MAG: universal stress protein [Desulfobacterales bacterium]